MVLWIHLGTNIQRSCVYLNVHIIAFVFVLYIHACICSLAYSTLLKEVTVIVNYYNTLLKILTQEN